MTRRYTTQHQPKTHLTFGQRLLFEQAYNDNLRTPKKDRLSKRKLAAFLGLPFSTFLREETRGLLPTPNTFRDRDIRDYSAIRAQDAIDAANMNKGRPMSMTNVVAKLLPINQRAIRQNYLFLFQDGYFLFNLVLGLLQHGR